MSLDTNDFTRIKQDLEEFHQSDIQIDGSVENALKALAELAEMRSESIKEGAELPQEEYKEAEKAFMSSIGDAKVLL